MTHKFQWTLLSSCLLHTPRMMLSITRRAVVFPMPGGFLGGWTMWRELCDLKGMAYPGGGDDNDDDDDDGADEEDSEVTPSYHPRKWRYY